MALSSTMYSSKSSVESSAILRNLNEASLKIVRIITFFTVNEDSFFYHNSVLLHTSEEIYPVLNSQLFCNLNYSFPSAPIPIPTKHIETSNLAHIHAYLRLLLGLLSDLRLSATMFENNSPTDSRFNFLEPFKPLSKSANKSKRSSLINTSPDFSSHKSLVLSSSSAQNSLKETKKTSTKKRFSSKFNFSNNNHNTATSIKPSSIAKTSLLKFSTSAVHQRMAILDLVDESTKSKERKSVSALLLSTASGNNDNSESVQSGFDDSSIFSNNGMEMKELLTLHSNNSSGSSNSLLTAQSMFSNSGVASTHLKDCSYASSSEYKYAIDTFLVFLKTYYKILKSLKILFASYKFEDKNQTAKDLQKILQKLLTKLNHEVLDKFFNIINEVAITKVKQNFEIFLLDITDDSSIFSANS